MKITPADISHVADLARLSMTREEGEAMARQLEEILSYVAKLNELDTAGVAPTTHAISIVNGAAGHIKRTAAGSMGQR
jgi:aspartyl-tRNA(Asn)/glutamyl-tRNA(Gln) amidotransferase subunit C